MTARSGQTPRQPPRPHLLALGALPLLFISFFLLAPALRLATEGQTSFTSMTITALWQDHYLRWRLLWSLLQAGATCLLVLSIGLPVAWVLARFQFAGRALVLRLLMLPFVVPTLVAALGVLALWGPRGLSRTWLGVDLQDTPWLLLYGNVFFNLCLLVRAGIDGLSQVSASRLAAARTLGATPWRAFWRIEWPAARPWLASSLCLVFLYCFSGFGLALVLGGQHYATLEVEIYTLVAYELKLADASALAVVTMLVTGLAALLYTLRERGLATPSQSDCVAVRRPVGALQWAMVVTAMAALLACCAAPVLAIAARALLAGPAAWAVVMDASTLQALWNTLRFSGAALILATVLGLTHALAAQRSALLRAAAYLPFVVSPVMVAFGLLLLYPQWAATQTLLISAYALLAYPFIAKSISAALDSLIKKYQTEHGEIELFLEVILPATHLIIYGGNYDIYSLVKLAKEIGWKVSVVCNPLKVHKTLFDLADAIISKEQANEIAIDDNTVAVLMAHDYETDFKNMRNLLKTNILFIGMLGPKKRTDKMFLQLMEEGNPVSEQDLKRIASPVGLDIGATTPEEIAISIIAEVKTFFSGRDGSRLKFRDGAIYG